MNRSVSKKRLPAIVVASLLLCNALTGQHLKSAGGLREAKYYRLSQFAIGNLRFTGVSVALVAVRPKVDESGREAVPLLHLVRASVTLVNSNGNNVLIGELAESSPQDAAGQLSGAFSWTNDQITSVALSSIKLRLKKASLSSKFAKGVFEIPPTQTLFVNSNDISSSEGNGGTGQLDVTFENSSLQKAELSLNDLRTTSDFRSTGPTTLRFALGVKLSSIVTTAHFANKQVHVASSQTLASFIPGLTVGKGDFTFTNLSLSVEGGSQRIGADKLTIANPILSLTKYPDYLVVGANLLTLDHPKAAANTSSDGSVATSAWDGAPIYSVAADPDVVVQELNLAGPLHQDVLLPTNNPDIRFISSYAAANFLEGLQQSGSQKKATHLTLKGKDGVVTEVTKDFVKKELEHPDLNIPKVVCSVAVDYYTGQLAANAVLSVARIVYQSRGALTLATYLNINSKLNPRLAAAAGYSVAKVTGFLTEKNTGKIISAIGEINQFSPGDLICDVLLGGTYIPSNTAVVLYRPQIMTSISIPPEQWTDIDVRYSTLLDGVARVPLTPLQMRTYKGLQRDAAARTAFLMNVISEQSAVADLHQKTIQQFKQDAADADMRASTRQQNIQGYDTSILKPQTTAQKQSDEAQRQANQGNGYAGGIQPPGAIPNTGTGGGPASGTTKCGYGSDGTVTLCYTPK